MNSKNVKNISKKNKSGFSLIEVLIAILILSIGMASISILMLKSMGSLRDSNKQLVASMLAQEGIELMRNKIDNDSDPIVNITTGTRRIDKDGLFDSTASYRLYSNANNFYTHNGAGTSTKFLRKIDIVNDAVNENITITAWVSWNDTDIPATCNIINKCASFVSVIPVFGP